jgi:hypothetical protein
MVSPELSLKVAVLSDVSVGYGSPQVLRIAESFAKVFGAKVHIFEPDEPERPPVRVGDYSSEGSIEITRLYTASHPYRMEGRIEYCAQVVGLLRAMEPDVLIFFNMYGIQVLDRIDTQGKLKIFYCLEDVDPHYSYLFPLVRQCDIRVFPEENRRRIYSERLGIVGDGGTNVLLYNANNRGEWTDPAQRQARLFYGGGFDRHANLASYFLDPEVIGFPVDVYGVIRGFENDKEVARSMNGAGGGLAYHGYRQTDDAFFQLLSRYLYAIVIWNPDREDRVYACPNKLFDAIACGVPPIAAPHPQCVEIIEKWNCGILMDDWSFDSFKATLTRALKAAGSDYHRELAFNCRRAVQEELSWDRQFGKFVPAIRKLLAQKGLMA